jgi:eukaryotic-like serine/threonine-protein kinase
MTIEGRVLADRYAVGQHLGRGGMAEVYLATDRVLDRPVAIKVLGDWLAGDRTFVERFRREALAAARLSHPGLVAVYDAGSDAGIHYIVMERVPGRTLADVLRAEGRPPPARAAAIASGVADALGVAHRVGIVHRDVKPANVMLQPDGRTKLMDLGIARGTAGTSITRGSAVLGTAAYVSPEQARGEPVDHRADIYALGCVLYEMLTGRPPFVADNPVAVAYQHVHEPLVSPSSLVPTIPPGLEAVALRAMAKDPDARYQDVADMRGALDGADEATAVAATAPQAPVAATAPIPVAAPTERLPRRADRPPPRRRPALLALALIVLLAAGGLAFSLTRDQTPTDAASADGRSGRSRASSPTLNPSPSPSPTNDPGPVASVQDALAALQAVVTGGFDDGEISEDAARLIADGLGEAIELFEDGEADEAIDRLEELEGLVDELVDRDEIEHSQERKLDKAIEDLARRMYDAARAGDD